MVLLNREVAKLSLLDKKKRKRRLLVWVAIIVVVIAAVILVTDFLRWQMVRGLFWRPGEINPQLETVVIIDPMYTPPEENLLMNPAYTLADYVQQQAAVNIDIIHYPEAGTERVLKHDPVCVLISGQTAPWTDYKPSEMEAVFSFLRETELPVLGICGGHQLIAQAYGVLVAPMGYQELGYIQVELLADDPLLDGLESPVTVFSWHGEEIKEMPEEFILLGSSELCRVQIFRHREKEIFGVQFHPELSGRKPDGKIMLLNFFAQSGMPLE